MCLSALLAVGMASLTAALGMLPLAYGIGAGAEMLRPLGIAFIGALFFPVPLSLIATPAACYLMTGCIRDCKGNPTKQQSQPRAGGNDPGKRSANGFEVR